MQALHEAYWGLEVTKIKTFSKQAERAALENKIKMQNIEVRQEEIKAQQLRLNHIKEEFQCEKRNNLKLFNSFQAINKQTPHIAAAISDAMLEEFYQIETNFEKAEEDLKRLEKENLLEEDEVRREYKKRISELGQKERSEI